MFSFQYPIPVTVHPLFILVALWIGYLITQDLVLSFGVAIIVFLSVLIHEYGHAFTARFFKQKTSITLQLLGGLTERRGPPLKKWQEFLIVLNGPLAGFTLSIASYLLFTIYPNVFLWIAFQINLWWTILNLIPILPMDGGQLMKITLEGIFGLKGLKLSVIISLVLGLLATAYMFMQQQIFIGAIFAIFTFESYRLYKSLAFMKESDTDSSIRALMDQAEASYKAQDIPKARTLYELVREKAEQGSLFAYATFRLAEIEGAEGHFARAYDLIKPVRAQLDQEGMDLFHRLAFETGDWKTVLSVKDVHLPEQMAMNAIASAQLQDANAAKGWLKAYINEGGDAKIVRDPRFDPIRSRLDI